MKRRRSQRSARSTKGSESPRVAVESGWRDRAITATWVLVPLLSVPAVLLGMLWIQWRSSIDQRLGKWKTTYGLSDDIVREFRRIELEFHGSGNIFTTPIARTPSENLVHHQQMAQLLDKPIRDKFINDLNTGRWNH